MADPVEQRIEQEAERDEERPAEHPAGELAGGAFGMQRPDQRLNQLDEREHRSAYCSGGPARVPVGARLIQPRERHELTFVEGTRREAEAGRQILNAETIRN